MIRLIRSEYAPAIDEHLKQEATATATAMLGTMGLAMSDFTRIGLPRS